MALAFLVADPDGIGEIFAAHDEFLAIATHFIAEAEEAEAEAEEENRRAPARRPLTPRDDHYSAPFCFLPRDDDAGFLVFTTQVPWLHRSAHREAVDWMRERGRRRPPILGTAEEFERKLKLGSEECFTFTEDGCYPNADNVSRALEDRAVEVTCAVLGWDVPNRWRQRRKTADLHGIPVLDLAVWDARHGRAQKKEGDAKASGEGVPKNNTHGEQEEKKDPTEEYNC